MEKITGQIHSIIYSDYDVWENEFVEVRVRIKPTDMSIDEMDLLRKAGKVFSYVMKEKNFKGEQYRELRIRYDPVDIRGYLQEGGLLIDLEPIGKKLLAVLSINKNGKT